jgi:sulfur carrier protein
MVNGEERDVPAGASVAVLVEIAGAGVGERGVAVAVDGEVVPRAEWESRALSEGENVEVVRAVQGG